ncbi:MAG: hypothetical protein NC093_00505 [Alistipes sp.]|nr:hypothetical protein [Alistipes sp.]
MRNYYYISEKKYIISQLERNGIHVDDFDISDYCSVCETAEYLANLLDEKGLINFHCSDVVSDYINGRKKPFVFLTFKDMKYYFQSFDAVIWAVSEYRAFGQKVDFITIICDKLTEEITDRQFKKVSRKYFGRIHFHSDELHVLGKISFDENKVYIQPIIIY